MKGLYLLLLIIILTLHAQSQQRVEVETGQKKMSKGAHIAFTVLIPNSQTDEIEAMWRKYVNVRHAGERIDNMNTQIGNLFKSKENRVKRDRLKMVKSGDESYVRAVEIEQLSSYPLDVYAVTTQLPEGCRLSAFFQYTDSTFIDSTNVDANKFRIIQDYVRDFAVNAYRTIMDNNIKLASKEVNREQNRLKDLQSSILREEKSILRNEAVIEESIAKIAQLKSDSANMVKTIASKEEELASLDEDSADYILAERELKILGKEKYRYTREIRTLKNRIKSKELDIESARNQIASHELEIDNQHKIIENKQQVAAQLIREKGEIE